MKDRSSINGAGKDIVVDATKSEEGVILLATPTEFEGGRKKNPRDNGKMVREEFLGQREESFPNQSNKVTHLTSDILSSIYVESKEGRGGLWLYKTL